tara:strand:+ start:424 stop:1095 length:672 start_codon:yes stop_codon:yes gene_type:complete
MNKLITILALMIASLGFSAANAGQFGLGVSGSIASIDASGTEADKDGTADSSLRKASAGNNAMVGSIFAEYSFDNGFTIGVDHIPGEADVSNSTITRTDDSAESAQDGNRSANAHIDNHMTYYAELPIHAGLYVKAGMLEMDVTADESDTVTTAGSYGTVSIDGEMWGIGYKNSFGNNGFYKVEATKRTYDSITLNSTTSDKGNKITADVDATLATFALGFNF